MLHKKILLGLVLAVFLASMASSALANSVWFNVIVPKLGGSATTNLTTKDTNQNQWDFSSITVGANKTVRFRPLKNGSAIGNFYNGTTGSFVWGPYTSLPSIGERPYGQIATNWSELVNVQVSGYFNSH